MREMSLQTNIEIKRVPNQSEELQKEIVGMLANLMNGQVDVRFFIITFNRVESILRNTPIYWN